MNSTKDEIKGKTEQNAGTVEKETGQIDPERGEIACLAHQNWQQRGCPIGTPTAVAVTSDPSETGKQAAR
jgi:hypothetical protein